MNIKHFSNLALWRDIRKMSNTVYNNFIQMQKNINKLEATINNLSVGTGAFRQTYYPDAIPADDVTVLSSVHLISISWSFKPETLSTPISPAHIIAIKPIGYNFNGTKYIDTPPFTFLNCNYNNNGYINASISIPYKSEYANLSADKFKCLFAIDLDYNIQ